MPISKDVLDQIRHLLRPLSTRVVNIVARGVIRLVDDSKKMQLVQLGVDQGSPVEGSGGGAERFEPFGLASVPLPGAEAVVLFPNGDRTHPLVIAVSDRRARPNGGAGGDVTLYNVVNGALGAKVILHGDTGDVEIQPGPGGKVRINDGSGDVALPTMDDFNGIISILNSSGSGPATAVPAAVTAYQAANPTWPAGTDVLQAK